MYKKKGVVMQPVESVQENDTKPEHKVDEETNTIDLKFMSKHKKMVAYYIETWATEYLIMIRPTNDKAVTIDTQSKYQIMFIFKKLIDVMSKMVGNPPDDIKKWVEKSLPTCSSEYKIFNFLLGATHDMKYNLTGEVIEEKMLRIISDFVVVEDLCQYTTELFLLFIKRLSEALANFNWDSTKKINAKLVNAILRNMNGNNTNPNIFDEIYNSAEHCKPVSKK